MQQSQQIIRTPFLRRHKSFFIGLFVLIPAIGIPTFFVYSLFISGIFEKWGYVYVTYDNTFGLEEGNSVTYRSQKIGFVSRIDLNENNVNVELKINQKYFPYIKKDSVAQLTQKFIFVGDWWIAISPGKTGSPSLTSGDVLTASIPIVIQKNLEQINFLIGITAKLAKELEERGVIDKLFGSSEDSFINSALEANKKAVNMMDDAKIIMQKVNALLDDSKLLLNNSKSMLAEGDALTKDSKIFIKSMIELTALMTNVMKDMKHMIQEYEKIPPEMMIMIGDMQQTMNDASKILDGVQNNWLFKWTFKK